MFGTNDNLYSNNTRTKVLPKYFDTTLDLGSAELFNINEQPTNGIYRCDSPGTASQSLELNGYVSGVPNSTTVAQLKVTYYIDFFN